MNILKTQLNAVEFPLHEELDLLPLNRQCPLTILTEHLVSIVAAHPDVCRPVVQLNHQDYPDVAFPPEGSTIEVDILLCSSSEALLEWTSEDSCGVFMVTSGLLEDSMFARRLRVGIPCDIEALRAFVLEERQKEINPASNQHDLSYLEAYLVTLTHEVAHAIDFITHAGGLSPSDVDVLCDSGEIDFDVQDAATGVIAREEMGRHSGSPADAIDAMEERVEALGRQWLLWALAKADQHLVQACLDAVCPADESLEMACLPAYEMG